ncbi:uncharacterized protein C2845_PMPSC056040 [Panicum miliaceum]|uniref:Uncharacterized protein n=1 Tax=Panicum miliaceum TaxID=4540 RepID=A0A3L6P965_PANMI|nr:uncharacterized protein C2845_PMPSC056040 [Panicum miliaceum]
MDEPSYFPALLQDVLWELGSTVKPLYVMDHYSDPAIGDYYLTRVHIRECMETSRGMRTRSVHAPTVPHSTYVASISNVAKRVFGPSMTLIAKSSTLPSIATFPAVLVEPRRLWFRWKKMEKTASTSLLESLQHSIPTSSPDRPARSPDH